MGKNNFYSQDQNVPRIGGGIDKYNVFQSFLTASYQNQRFDSTIMKEKKNSAHKN